MQQQISELWLHTCASTNDEAIRLAKSGVISGSFVVADQQSAGRGRRGRTWNSPPGGLYMSVITRPLLPAGEEYRVALAAGVAVAEDLMSITSYTELRLKWPNDIVFGDRKLGGLLTEVTPGAIVVGIGINLVDHGSVTGLPAGSVALEDLIQRVPNRTALARSIARTVNKWSSRCYSSEFLDVVQRWRTYMSKDLDVSAEVQDGPVQGKQHDMQEDGSLVLRDEQGNNYSVSCGDVQVIAEQ
jgi:BirA family transcriptional regulator, biotin operon repressor / biotin---[acetyl-CoA-carboxylase] ligase